MQWDDELKTEVNIKRNFSQIEAKIARLESQIEAKIARLEALSKAQNSHLLDATTYMKEAIEEVSNGFKMLEELVSSSALRQACETLQEENAKLMESNAHLVSELSYVRGRLNGVE